MELVNTNTELSTSEPWFKLDLTGLDVTRVPTWDEWLATGTQLAALHQSLPMVIGDFINAGEDTFGEKYEQVLDLFGQYDYNTVANYASVTRNVPKERRLSGLTYSHIKALTACTPEEQIAFQKQALAENMSSGDFWRLVKGTALDFAGWCDKFHRMLGELYHLTTNIKQEAYLDEAREALIKAKDNYLEQERATKERTTGESQSGGYRWEDPPM